MSTRHPFDLTLAELHRLNLDVDPHLKCIVLGAMTSSFAIELVLTCNLENHNSCPVALLKYS